MVKYRTGSTYNGLRASENVCPLGPPTGMVARYSASSATSSGCFMRSTSGKLGGGLFLVISGQVTLPEACGLVHEPVDSALQEFSR